MMQLKGIYLYANCFSAFAQISPLHEKCQNGESFFPEMEIKTNPQKNHYLRQKAMLCML